MRKIWPFTFNVLTFAGFASAAPFTVLYYQKLGFTGTQIGLLTSLTPLIAFFSAPLWTRLADATRQHRLIMSLAILAGVITISLFPLLNAFVPILLVAALFNFFYAPIPSFADSATMFMLADQKELYGRIRLGGTIGFGLAAPIAGALVQSYGLKFAFWTCAALFLLSFFASQKLVHGQSTVDNSVGGNLGSLLKNPRWPPFLTLAFAGGLASVATSSFFYPYMKELGASESTMGLALTIGTISEIPVLFFGDRLIKRLKAYRLLVWVMVLTGFRLLLFAAAGTPNIALLIQVANGLTFPAMWLAGVSYADENAPAGMKSTAQGLFSAMVYGFGTAAGGLTGGLLLERVGGRNLFLVFGIVVLTIVVVVTLIQKLTIANGRIRSHEDG